MVGFEMFQDEEFKDFSPEEIAYDISSTDPYFAEFSQEEIADFGVQLRKEADWAGGVGTALTGGFSDLWDRTKATVNTLFDDKEAVERLYEETKYTQDTPTQEAFSRALQHRTDEGDEGLLDAIGNVAGAILDEPMGALHMGIEQLPNIGLSLGGGLAGGKLGAVGGATVGTAVAPGPGTAVGGAVGAVGGFLLGMFGANFAIETGAEALQAAEGGYTEEERRETIEYGAKKSLLTTGVDALTLKASSLIGGAPGRLVEKSVFNSMKKKGIKNPYSQAAKKQLAEDPELLKEVLTDAAKPAYDAVNTFASRATRGTSAMGLETVGEGGGEYLGELYATGEASPTEAVLESIMAGPMSVAELRVAKGLTSPGEITQQIMDISGATSVEEAIAMADNNTGSALQESEPLVQEALTQAQLNQLEIDKAFDETGVVVPQDLTREQLNQLEIDKAFDLQVQPGLEAVTTPEEIARSSRIDEVGPVSVPEVTPDKVTDRDVDVDVTPDKVTDRDVDVDVTPAEVREGRKTLAGRRLEVQEAAKLKELEVTEQAKVELPDVKVEVEKAIEKAARKTDTTPSPDLIESGEYRKGKVDVHGLPIAIENPEGSVRTGKDKEGEEWSQLITNHYGYIEGTQGKDGGGVDVFLGPDSGNADNQVYVIDQKDMDTGRFDEHKAMVGFTSESEAVKAYSLNNNRGTAPITGVKPMSLPEFKAWVSDPVKTGRKSTLRRYVPPTEADIKPDMAPVEEVTPAEVEPVVAEEVELVAAEEVEPVAAEEVEPKRLRLRNRQ